MAQTGISGRQFCNDASFIAVFAKIAKIVSWLACSCMKHHFTAKGVGIWTCALAYGGSIVAQQL